MTEPANRPPHLQRVSEEDDLDNLLIREDELPQQPPPRTTRRRQFRRFDEPWAIQLLAADPPVSAAVWRLSLVILAAADFRRQFLVSDRMSAVARLTRSRKREAVERLEQLGLIAVEWRGQGRAPRVTPLSLGGRPGRR
jgi:hypothetical protein